MSFPIPKDNLNMSVFRTNNFNNFRSDLKMEPLLGVIEDYFNSSFLKDIGQ